MKISEKIRDVALQLQSTPFNDPRREAEIIIQKALSLNTVDIQTANIDLTEEQDKRINNILLRRINGEPLQYIIGEISFFDLVISVGKGVFIPRPETELMTEQAIRHLREKGFNRSSQFYILDLCTGSGCIALALGLHFPEAVVIASDISMPALNYARKNALINNIKNVSFVAGDLFTPFRYRVFDLVISNPPYIISSEISELQREIRDHEPINALDGGEDGYFFYSKIFENIRNFIHNHGSIIIELGYGQYDRVASMAHDAGFKHILAIKDYSDIDRVMIAYNS